MATFPKDKDRHAIIDADSRPSAKKLQRHVIPHVATKWYELGLELLDEKEEHELNNIKSNYGSDVKRCCLEMFLLWLNANSDANWWLIVEALKSPGVELSTTAAELEKKLSVKHPVTSQTAVDSDQSMIESCDSENVNFAEFEDVSLAFSTLLSRLQKEIKIKDFVIIRNACVARASHKLSDQIKKTQDVDSLFQLFADNKAYCNWMNIRFLEVIANATGDSKLVSLVKNYKGVIYSKTLREVWDCIPYHTVRTKYYSRLQVKFDGKDPDNITIEQLMRFCEPYIVKDIAMLIAIIEEGSLKVTWFIPTDEVHNCYLAALMLPQESRLDSYLQIGDWIVHHPLLVIQNLHKEHPTLSSSTLLIGYYHGLLMKHIDANFLISKMRSNGLLTSYDEELILTGHSSHQRNWLLLEHVQRMQTQTLMGFCEFIQEIAPGIGLQLVTALGSHVIPEYPESEIDELSGVTTVNHPPSLHILFLKVINQIEELLQLGDLTLLTETCKSLLASKIHGISLFSTAYIKILVKCNNAVTLLRYLSFLNTWSNHSILRALISFNRRAVQLLDKYDSLLDPLNVIVSYPIPNFSQGMIPSETSKYALLTVSCNRELWRCSLQYVFSLQSFIVKICDLTQHCLQLLALKSDPTEFYWTIPKCVVKLVESNVSQHSHEYLRSQGVLEVSVYPKQSHATGDDKETVKDHLKPVHKSTVIRKFKKTQRFLPLLSRIPEDHSKHEYTPHSRSLPRSLPASNLYNTSTHEQQEQLPLPDKEEITHYVPIAYGSLRIVSEKAEQIISRFEKMRMDSGETTDTLFPFPVEQPEKEEDIIQDLVPNVSQPTLPPMTALQWQFSEFPLEQSVLTLGQDGYYLEDRDYNLVRYAGAGGSASCYLGNDKTKSSQFIIKKMKYTEEERRYGIKESHILQEIDRDNVIRFYGAVEDLDHCFKMFLEYPDETCGDIHYLFCESEDKESLSGNIVLIMLYIQQILLALDYLHCTMGILHLDIKGKNVIVCSGGYRVKLIDFGTACKANSVPLTLRWAPVFAAPEINNQSQPPMFSADIWSAMCVAVEMVTENLPWPRVTNYQTAIYKIGFYEDDQITELVEHDEYWDKYGYYEEHHDMYQELVNMWKVVFCKDSSSRPSANYLLNLKWMREMELHGESILYELACEESYENDLDTERDHDDYAVTVENTNDATDNATIVADHHSELISSSSFSQSVDSSYSPYHESSDLPVSNLSLPSPSVSQHSPDNSNPQTTGYADRGATTDQSDSNNESGTAPGAKYDNTLDHLLTVFQATLSKKQICVIFDLACHDFDITMECLLFGPDLNNILKLMSRVSKTYPVVKVHLDQCEIWSDLVSFYKTPNVDISKCHIRICLNDQPAIDTGGIRCQVYTSVLQQFSENLPFRFFDGPPNSLRPYYSAANRSSGIFKILGRIVGHSIFQDGIGFPHLSALCYWYMAAGEQAALQNLTLNDVGADCCNFIRQLNQAKSNQEVTAACNSEGAAEFLSRVGVTYVTTMANKDTVAQSIMQHEGLFKITALLDQFKEGLRNANMENLIESYPNEFAPLFVFSGEIRAIDVIQALYMGNERIDTVSMGLLQQYIYSLSLQELKDFMVCVTGSHVTKERSILVTFDTDPNGVIAIHTCTNEISLPFGTFQEADFELFKSSMDAIIKGSDRLTYNIV